MPHDRPENPYQPPEKTPPSQGRPPGLLTTLVAIIASLVSGAAVWFATCFGLGGAIVFFSGGVGSITLILLIPVMISSVILGVIVAYHAYKGWLGPRQ